MFNGIIMNSEIMLLKEIIGGWAIVVGVLIAFTKFMQWPDSLNYLWAVLVLIFGILWLSKK